MLAVWFVGKGICNYTQCSKFLESLFNIPWSHPQRHIYRILTLDICYLTHYTLFEINYYTQDLNMPTVNDILLSDQTNTEEVVNALTKALEEESSLELYPQGLNVAALLNFAKALEQNKTVTNLSILGWEGDLSDEALKALTVALTNSQYLTHLSFNSSVHSNIISKVAQLLENNQPPLKEVTVLRRGDPVIPHQQWPRNSAKVLAMALEKNNTLETLDMSELALDNEEMEAVTVALKKHPHLSRLTIKAKKEAMHKLVEVLKTNQTLSYVNCAFNELHSVGMPLFVSFLKDNNTLRSLDLLSNELDPADTSVLADALKENKSVTELNLYGNKIGTKGAQVLADFLKGNNVLNSLNLGYNDIKDEGIEALATALETNSTLKELHLEGNTTGPQASKALAKALKQNHTLEDLSLFSLHCDIAALADALKYNHSLTKLKLYYGRINGERLKILSTALQDNDTLTTLDLASNEISDADVPSLIELLRNAPNLTTLDISNNDITFKGAQLLATFLETNPTSLTSLKLHDNVDIGIEGIKALTEALKKNTTLTELILPQSTRTPENNSAYKAIEELLKVNKTLTILQFDAPPSEVSQEAYVNISRAIKENKARAEKEGIELLGKKIQEDVPMFPAVIGKVVAEYAGSAPAALEADRKRAVREKVEHERIERETREKAQKEKAEQEAREKAKRERVEQTKADEQAVQEKANQERMERETREKAERERVEHEKREANIKTNKKTDDEQVSDIGFKTIGFTVGLAFLVSVGSGALLGAGIGALIGFFAGGPPGAAVGAGLGAMIGVGVGAGVVLIYSLVLLREARKNDRRFEESRIDVKVQRPNVEPSKSHIVGADAGVRPVKFSMRNVDWTKVNTGVEKQPETPSDRPPSKSGKKLF